MSMSPFPRRLAQGLVPLCLLLSLPAQTTTQVTPTKHPFLWRIDGRGEQTFAVKSWLFGTMHLGDDRLVTLPDSVEDARESVDALYCELAMDQMMKQQRRLMRKMLLPKGQILKDRLPKKLYRRLSDHVADRGSSMRTFQRMQVWAVNLNLALIDAMKEKMTKSLDVMIYKDAKADDKEVGGLETMDEQLAALADLPEQDHIKMLTHSLAYMEKLAKKGVSPLRRMLEIYLAGDGAKLMAVASEATGDKELLERFMKSMLFDRNVGMADRMAKMMAEHPQKSYFFAVGALHYPGKNGIVELLRRKGYKIQRIGAPNKAGTETRPSIPKQAGRKLERVGR
jgi:uncharacterized protein YbaP (TraB family)